MKYLKLSFIFLGLILSTLSYATEISLGLDGNGNYQKSIPIQLDKNGNYQDSTSISYNQIYLSVIGDAIQQGDSFYINITSSDVNFKNPPTSSLIAREMNFFSFMFCVEDTNVEKVTLNIEILKAPPIDILLNENGNYDGDVFVSPTGDIACSDFRVVHFDIIDASIQIGDLFSITLVSAKSQIRQAITTSKVSISVPFSMLNYKENGMIHVTVEKLNKEDYIKVTTRYHDSGFYNDDYRHNPSYIKEDSYFEKKGQYNICDYQLVECGYYDENLDLHNYYAIDTTRILVNNVNLSPENIKWDEEGEYFEIILDLQEDAVIDLYTKIIDGKSHFDEFDPNDNTPSGAVELQPNHIVTRTIGDADYADWYKIELKAGYAYSIISNADIIYYTYDAHNNRLNEEFMDGDIILEREDSTTYYIKASYEEYCGGDASFIEYQLVCQARLLLDAADPADDVAAGATVIVPNDTLQKIENRSVGKSEECDWFKFEMQANKPYYFYTLTNDVAHGLYSIPENSESEDDYECIEEECDGLHTYQVKTAGTYYLKVTASGVNRKYTLFYTTNNELADVNFHPISITSQSIYTSVKGGQYTVTITNLTDNYKSLNIDRDSNWVLFTPGMSFVMIPKSKTKVSISVGQLPQDLNERQERFSFHSHDDDYALEMNVTQTRELPNQLIVENGHGSGRYFPNSVVTIVADAPANGKIFDCWTTEDDTHFIADTTMSITTATLLKEEYTVTATYKNDTTPTPATKTIQLISQNGSGKTAYLPGESDIVSIKAESSTERVTLKCSGLTYGVDFIIAGHAPEGNYFNMTINELRQGVSLSFLNGGTTKEKTFKITASAKGWSLDKDYKCLVYKITPKSTSLSSLVSEAGNAVEMSDVKDFVYSTARLINNHKNSGSYDPQDGVFYPKENIPYGWLDALMDRDGSNVNIYSGDKKAPKQTMNVEATKIPEMNGKAFEKKPAFRNVTLDPFSKNPKKPKKTAIAYKNNTLTFKPTTKLYDTKQIKNERKLGKMYGEYTKCDSLRGSQIVFTYKDKNKNILVSDAPMGAIIISAPEQLTITKRFSSFNNKDSVMRISGNFLGTTPKAFYEYKDKNDKVKVITCKIKRYKKAGTDQAKVSIESQLATDGSYKTMDVTLPTLPKGSKLTPFHLIIDNGLGYAELKNAPSPKIKQ